MSFEAVIWDCDGCLVDSEHIACELGARLLTEAGYSITTENFIRRFCGQGKAHIFQSILDDSGVDYLPLIEATNKKELQKEAFRLNLKAIDHIHEVLDQITLPMAIASGSEYERLEYTLQLTDLYDRFKEKIFSSSLVQNGKPSPDIFLYVARQLNVSPEKCLAIEDSLNGAKAAKSAGMTVFGFTGGSHILDKQKHREELLALGVDIVFDDMSELSELIKNFPHQPQYAITIGPNSFSAIPPPTLSH